MGSKRLLVVGIPVLFLGMFAGAQNAPVSASQTPTSANASEVANAYSTSKELPDAPGAIGARAAEPDSTIFPTTPMALIATPIAPQKPTVSEKNYARDKKIWFSLMAIEHGAATFDAWSTRDAVGRGAHEVNPLMKPFATSAAMYPAAQLVPAGMDYLAHRLMKSDNHVLRKLWWVPQTLSTAASLTAGVHNLGVVGTK
jgi:hypothetical protein